MDDHDRYSAIINRVFQNKYVAGLREIEFERNDIAKAAEECGVESPKNLGDVIYSFRYRRSLPEGVRQRAGAGEVWVIRPAGRGKYRFCLVRDRPIMPNAGRLAVKIPDATPGIVVRYSFNDEQALLARLRYNRLLDIFTGVTCYSLQNHLRTTVSDMGQVEIDELYVGIDKGGVHHVFPIQAKGETERLNVVQIEQDMAVCAESFPGLVCRPIGTQFMEDGRIVLFEFAEDEDGVRIAEERHYRLVPSDELTEADLKAYRNLCVQV